MKRNLSNIFFKMAGIGILLVLIATGSNSIILKSSIHDKFKNAEWEGNWKSENFSLIGGKIIANMPSEIRNNEEFEVDAMIYYNIWSFYKMGEIIEFKLIGMFSDDNSGGGKNVIKENRELKHRPSINFKAKVFGDGNLKVDYSGIANRNKSLIVGGYKTSNPKDLGTFKIQKKL